MVELAGQGSSNMYTSTTLSISRGLRRRLLLPAAVLALLASGSPAAAQNGPPPELDEPGGSLWVNAGSRVSFEDETGRTWVSDLPWNVSGGSALISQGSIGRNALSDPTIPEAVFLSAREGTVIGAGPTDLVYSIPVNGGGYDITLYFAELCRDCVSPSLGGTGCSSCARVFDVRVEDLAAASLNPADASLLPAGDGKGETFAASELVLRVDSVPDGQLDILLDYADRGAPFLSAMRITRRLTGLEAPGSSLYLNAAGPELIDEARRSWTSDLPYLVAAQPEQFYPNSTADLSGLSDAAIPGALFQSERFSRSSLQYRIPASEDVYQVSLFFAEMCVDCVSPRLGGTGSLTATRNFAVEVEGELVKGFNPADAALPPPGDGVGKTEVAVRLDFLVAVEDGVLDLRLSPLGEQISPGYPILNALAVTRPDVELLRMDREDVATLTPKSPEKLYLLVGQPGEPAEIVATDRGSAGGHRLYLRWDAIPSPQIHDRASKGSLARQVLTIPTLRKQDCLLLLSADRLATRTEVVVLASSPRIRLIGMSPDSAFPSIASTVVSGLGFSESTAFRLQDASGAEIAPLQTTVVSPIRAELTFDLSRAAPGEYSLLARGEAGEDAIPAAFEVEKPGEPVEGLSLSYSLRGFGVFRVGELSRVTLVYENTGDEEIPAPLFRIVASEGTRMGLRATGDLQEGPLQVLGVNLGGVAGRLPGGVQREVHIYFIAEAGEELHFEVTAFTPGAGQLADYPLLPAPPGLSASQWNTLAGRIPEVAGNTWSGYQDVLATLSTRLHRRGRDPASVRGLFHLLSRMALKRPSSAIVGQVRDAATLEPLFGVNVVALHGGVPAATAVTDLQGYYTLDWLEGGQKYEIVADQYTIVSTLDGNPLGGQTPPVGGDLNAVDFLVEASSSSFPPACGNCDETGLPAGPVLPPQSLFTGNEGYFLVETNSLDPNEKKGPRKPSTPEHEYRICPEDTHLEYQISFRNDGAGPARRVQVVDEIDLAVFEPLSFQYEDVIIPLGTYPMTSPETDGLYQIYGDGSSTYGFFQTDGLSTDHFVEYSFDYDSDTGLLTCTLQTVDPFTLLPPLDPNIGFLPPGALGHISFSLSPKSGELEGGTEIKNRGSIKFDANAPFYTAYYTNVFSECLPEAPASPSPADQLVPRVPTTSTLSWEAADAEAFDVYFWPDGAIPSGPVAANRIAEALAPPALDPGALQQDTLYHWQVVASNPRGSTPGPLWTFRTEIEVVPEPEFTRGDANADDAVDIGDPVTLLFFIYTGSVPPACQKSADANDDGVVDQSDAVSLLAYLFLEQVAPLAPFPACGVDPTPDGLSCDAYPPCP